MNAQKKVYYYIIMSIILQEYHCVDVWDNLLNQLVVDVVLQFFPSSFRKVHLGRKPSVNTPEVSVVVRVSIYILTFLCHFYFDSSSENFLDRCSVSLRPAFQIINESIVKHFNSCVSNISDGSSYQL